MEFNYGDYQLPNFSSYKDYIRYFNTIEDSRYLRRDRLKQQVVKLGYRSNEPVYSDKEFWNRRRLVNEAALPKNVAEVCFGTFLTTDDPVLEALKIREPLNMQKKMSTIIFLKSRNKGGFELTGFIDFEQSCRESNCQLPNAVNWQAVFEGRISLKPRRSDLSFNDVHKKFTTYNQTDNFDVLHDAKYGVMFKHRGDRKVLAIGLDPPEQYRDNCTRTTIFSPKYGYVVFYDHNVRKKI